MPATLCPRCFAPVTAGRFCRRCGLRTVLADPHVDFAPMDLAVDGRPYRVLDRIAVGSRCVVYRCQFGGGGHGTFKVARDPVSNGAVAREAEVLRHLQAADAQGRFTPFVPAVVESFGYVGDRSEPPRHANVLRLHPDVRSPADDLFTLAEVKGAHPGGLDAKDVAWIWRRLLTALGFALTHGVAHGAVLPPHVLVDPADHKLFLIGWSSATLPGRPPVSVPPAVPAAYRAWVSVDPRPSAAADVRLGARSMADLLAPGADEAVVRHLDRCGRLTVGHPWHVRDEFDQLIQALWGPRQFRPLTMPTKTHSVY